MANRLKVQEQEAILNLDRRGWSIRRIARELRLSRNTVRGYLRKVAGDPAPATSAGAGALSVQTDPLSTTSAEQSNQTDPLSSAGNQGRKSLCLDLGPQILEKFTTGLTAQRIFQDLKAEVAFPGSYESVKRYVAKLRQTDPSVVQRIEVQPGEEVQADFGSGPTLIGSDGKKRRTWVFRLVLSYSRKE